MNTSQNYSQGIVQKNKKSRRNGYSYSKYKQSRVPRAIQTRGTPEGYYDIPYHQMVRLYCNTSSGFWPTDQGSMAPYGGAGYKGIGIAFQPNNTRVTFGNSGSTTSYEDFTISDFTNLQTIFDDVNLAKITVEAWINAQPSDTSAALSNAPEIWAANDANDCYPGTSALQEYAKVSRILPNRVTKLTFTPTIVSDNVADDGVGITTSAGQTTTGYVKTGSGCYHYGVKMWNWLPYEPDTAQVYYLQMRITIVRRFKRLR